MNSPWIAFLLTLASPLFAAPADAATQIFQRSIYHIPIAARAPIRVQVGDYLVIHFSYKGGNAPFGCGSPTSLNIENDDAAIEPVGDFGIGPTNDVRIASFRVLKPGTTRISLALVCPRNLQVYHRDTKTIVATPTIGQSIFRAPNPFFYLIEPNGVSLDMPLGAHFVALVPSRGPDPVFDQRMISLFRARRTIGPGPSPIAYYFQTQGPGSSDLRIQTPNGTFGATIRVRR